MSHLHLLCQLRHLVLLILQLFLLLLLLLLFSFDKKQLVIDLRSQRDRVNS